MRYKSKKTQIHLKTQKQKSSHVFSHDIIDTLWKKGDYEQLERILKTYNPPEKNFVREKSLSETSLVLETKYSSEGLYKKIFSGVLVENLSKLAFFQAEIKLIGNPAAFVSHILTGGACLIARNPLYHMDITDEIQLLANEIKFLFAQLKIKYKQKLTWDKSLFENFVDYEANILIQVLQLSVKKGGSNLDIIPTPGYLITHDAATKRISQIFLPWLASENKALFEMYDAETHRAVFCALSREKASDINVILKSAYVKNFDPYLRLALMLRAANGKKSVVTGIVQLSDFDNLPEASNLFKNVAIQMVRSMITEDSTIPLTTECWHILQEFYPVFKDPKLLDIFIAKSIQQLHEEYKNLTNLNLVAIKNIAHQMNVIELEQQIDVLDARQKVCSQFLLNLKTEKKPEKLIRNIKDKSTLEAHLTLIVDACCLNYIELSLVFFEHIESLANNKKINKLIPLNDLLDYDFGCRCAKCQKCFYREEMPKLANTLNLPVVHLPDVNYYSKSRSIPETQTAKSSVLSQPDPFEILDVTLFDSKPAIMQKVFNLIQQSPQKMAILRQAQNELFNPAHRFLHHYFRFLAYEKNNIETEVHPLPQHECVNAS